MPPVFGRTKLVEQVDSSVNTNTTGNASLTLISLQTGSATVVSSDQTNKYFKGVRLYLDTTEFSTSLPAEVLVRIQGKDPVTGNYVDIAGAEFTGSATGTKVMTMYPNIPASAALAVAEYLPLTWRAVANIAGTSSAQVTYSVGAELLR